MELHQTKLSPHNKSKCSVHTNGTFSSKILKKME